jgi:hypothetical protein
MNSLGKLGMLTREIEASGTPGGHVLKPVRPLMPIVEIGGRDNIEWAPDITAEVLINHDQLVRIAEGQWLEQYRAHDGKERSGGADTEGHDKNRGARKAR